MATMADFASRLFASRLFAAGVCALFASPALATDADVKVSCANDFRLAQELRDQGRLIDARNMSIRCASAACPGVVITECGKLTESLGARIPAVMVSVRDAAGNDTTSARLIVDEQPQDGHTWGTPLPLNPGKHEIRVVLGKDEQVVRIVLDEGEKQNLAVDFFQAPIEESTRESSSTSALVYVGFGLAAASGIGGAVTGALAMSAATELDARCKSEGCSREEIDEEGTIAHVSTALFAIAGAGAVVGVAGLFVSPTEEETEAVAIWPVVGPSYVGIVGQF